MGFPQQEYWSGLPLPPAVDHVLSELFTMTCLFWVTLHEKAHSLTELRPPLHHTSSGPWSRYSLLISCYGCIFCQQLELMETNILTLETMVWLLKAFKAHLAYSESWQGTWPVPYPVFSVTPAAFQVHPAFVILSSVQFIHSVISDSLWSHEPEHSRPPCPSPTPGIHPNPCPFSQWCHPNISSSVVPFSSCPQSFPASGSFPVSQLFTTWPKFWSFSFSISPSNEHPGLIPFRMDWLDLPAVQRTLKSLLQHHSSKASILLCSAFFTVQLSHPYMTTGKTIALTRWTFIDTVMSLLLNMLSRLVITFLPRSKLRSLPKVPWVV